MYDRGCGRTDVACPVAFWVERAAILSASIAQASRRPAAIDIFTECWPKQNRSIESGVVVRVHSGVDPALKNALKFAPSAWVPRSQRYHVRCLQKWIVWAINDAEFVVYLDLDVLPFTPLMEVRVNLIVDDWLTLFELMRQRNLRLVSEPDGSSPLNGGILVVRPSSAIYLEGIALLKKANSSFNASHGWGLRGPPRQVIPATDDAWTSRAPATAAMLQSNEWTFYAAGLDQGLFFFIARVLHKFGADLPFRTESPTHPIHRQRVGTTHRLGRWCIPHCSWKPYLNLPRTPRCILPRAGGLRKVVAYLRDGIDALRYPRARILPFSMCRACRVAWEEGLECARNATLRTKDLVAWTSLASTPIDKACTHKKCCPDCPRGSLFFI